MKTLAKLKIFRAVLCITLIGNTTAMHAMKRSYEDNQEENTILGLPPEVWQKILSSLPDKHKSMQVCKYWNTLLKFKDYWFYFIGNKDIARTLHLTLDAQLRIYRLLLASTHKDAIPLLDTLLANDSNRSLHLQEVSTITHTPLLNLMSDAVRSSTIIKNYHENFTIISIPANISSLDLNQKKEASHKNDCTQYIATLCDILLRDDQQTLDQFLEDPRLYTVFDTDNAIDEVIEYGDSEGNLIYNVDFLIDNDLITRFCSINTVRKLIPLLNRIFVDGGECDKFRLTDYLLHRALFGTVQRLDIADVLLLKGADWKFRHMHSDKDYDIRLDVMKHQNPNVWELLFKYGLTLSDVGIPIDQSPLWYSVCQQKSPEFVQKLLDTGWTNPFEINSDGRDILDKAKELGNQEIVKALETARLTQKMKIGPAIAQQLKLEGTINHLEIIDAYEHAWGYFSVANGLRNYNRYHCTLQFLNGQIKDTGNMLSIAFAIFDLNNPAGTTISKTMFIIRYQRLIAKYAFLEKTNPLVYKSVYEILKTAYDIVIPHINNLQDSI